jgi:hypothetical protein
MPNAVPPRRMEARWVAQGSGEQRAPLGRPSHLSSSPGSSLTHGQGIASLPVSAALPPHADASMHRVGAGRHALVMLHVNGAVFCSAGVARHRARGGADVAMHMVTKVQPFCRLHSSNIPRWQVIGHR